MFEVIYISPSCKQTVNFINDLAIKLKQHGIDSFDIDHKNIQLKSDKFIVSAVDIFGGKLGLSHYMIEYYIDMVSDITFPRNCTKTCAHERLKDLKRTFRENTKEIFKEELIEILMEVLE